MTLKNVKIVKLPVTLETSNFQELFVMKLDSKSIKLILNENYFVEVIYHKKPRGISPL